jgi:hypothetical protein
MAGSHRYRLSVGEVGLLYTASEFTYQKWFQQLFVSQAVSDAAFLLVFNMNDVHVKELSIDKQGITYLTAAHIYLRLKQINAAAVYINKAISLNNLPTMYAVAIILLYKLPHKAIAIFREIIDNELFPLFSVWATVQIVSYYLSIDDFFNANIYLMSTKWDLPIINYLRDYMHNKLNVVADAADADADTDTNADADADTDADAADADADTDADADADKFPHYIHMTKSGIYRCDVCRKVLSDPINHMHDSKYIGMDPTDDSILLYKTDHMKNGQNTIYGHCILCDGKYAILCYEQHKRSKSHVLSVRLNGGGLNGIKRRKLE